MSATGGGDQRLIRHDLKLTLCLFLAFFTSDYPALCVFLNYMSAPASTVAAISCSNSNFVNVLAGLEKFAWKNEWDHPNWLQEVFHSPYLNAKNIDGEEKRMAGHIKNICIALMKRIST